MEQPLLRTIIKILSGRQNKDDLHVADKHLAESFEKNEWSDTAEDSEKIKARITNSVLNKTKNQSKNNNKIYRTGLKIAAAVTLIAFLGYYVSKYNFVKNLTPDKHYTFRSDKPGLSTSSGDFRDVTLMTIGETYSGTGFFIKRESDNLFSFRSKENSHNPTQIRIATATNDSYQIELPDHSRVTLDANSELIFPSKFENNSRHLEATGKLFFKVSKDSSRPFAVKSKNMTALVKGTSFVFNTDNQTENSFIALIEGSLEMESENSRVLLKPGQKGTVKNSNLAVNSFDADEVVSFTRNEFLFQNQPIKMVMNEIARWYQMDLDLSAIDPNGHQLTLKINRNKPLHEVLDILELTGDLKFKIKERRITVRRADN
ncbi:MAG: FecR family protein [Sphingobacterium sp.]